MPLFPDPAKYDLALQLKACQSSSRRNGKVARLPSGLRDQINRMLEDGLPYKLIIQKLGPAGQNLNEDNLSNWRLGGFQDYLKTVAIYDRARAQTEAAAELVRESADLDPSTLERVCREMALLHFLETLCEHGDQLARESLQKNPAKFITLINACCNSSNTTLAILKRKAGPLPSPTSAPELGQPRPAAGSSADPADTPN